MEGVFFAAMTAALFLGWFENQFADDKFEVQKVNLFITHSKQQSTWHGKPQIGNRPLASDRFFEMRFTKPLRQGLQLISP